MSKLSMKYDDLSKHIEKLLSDYNYDKYWFQKIINSIYGISILFKTEIKSEQITRERLNSNELWIVYEDELDFTEAKRCINKFENSDIYPITVIRCNEKNILYMGSVRSLYFSLKNMPIEALVVSLNNIGNSIHFNRRIKLLSEYLY